MRDMSEIAATSRAPRTSPFGVLAFGLIVAFLGGLAMAESLIAGWVLIAAGGVMVQFGLIAGAVELAILRARER